MAWIEVNSHLDDSYGYLHGFGNDQGWFCYKRGEDDWIVATSFEPYFKNTPFGDFYAEPYTYNDNTVYRNIEKTMFIFKSKSPGEKWIVFDRLQEPISYLDIDLSTLIGDGWYELYEPPRTDLTSFSEQNYAFPRGTYSGSNIGMNNEFRCCEYVPKTSPWPWVPGDTMPFGRYKDEDNNWKIVGNPVWQTVSQDTSVTNLPVNYIGSDEDGTPMYHVGNMVLRAHGDVLAIGTPNVGRWYEGTLLPSPDPDAEIKYSAYEREGETKKAITSGDIEIRYSHTGRGDLSAFCYMGEVAQWH